jgi:hypothetical protein
MSLQFQQNPIAEEAPLQDEVIIFHPPTKKFCVLNRTSSFIWSHLKNPITANQLAEEISRSFQGVNVTQARHDLEFVLQEMLSLGLIRERPSESPHD